MAACLSAILYFRGAFICAVLLREGHPESCEVSARSWMDSVEQEQLPADYAAQLPAKG